MVGICLIDVPMDDCQKKGRIDGYSQGVPKYRNTGYETNLDEVCIWTRFETGGLSGAKGKAANELGIDTIVLRI